jgi:hypothetical protein
MSLKFDDYQNHHDLLKKIRHINRVYYEPAAANILKLQKNSGEMDAKHAVSLRDAYSHLAKIFEYEDIMAADNKAKIARQLERYLGHLEELLYDTYLKIIKKKTKDLLPNLYDKYNPKIKKQLAEKKQKVRMVDDKTPIEQKIENFNEIIRFIEANRTTP